MPFDFAGIEPFVKAMIHSSVLRIAMAAISLLVPITGFGGDVSKSTVPDYTISPNARYGVTVPHFQFDETRIPDNWNMVVDLATSRPLGKIKQKIPAYDRTLNHHQTASPVWSSDSSLLLWKVNGRWFPDSFVVVRVEQCKLVWQLDVLAHAQQEILKRTKGATPKKYEEAKAANSRNGSAYCEGFSVDVKALAPINYPLGISVILTSNPKSAPGIPNLHSRMEATVDVRGNFRVLDFALEKWPAYQTDH